MLQPFRRRPPAKLLFPALVLAIAAAGSAGAGPGNLAAGAAPSQVAETCPLVKASPPRAGRLEPPRQALTRAARLVAVVSTNCGGFSIGLDARRSPIAVNSFVYLARKGFYDGLRFDRVIPDFVVQGGDPRGNGASGPGYRVIDPPPQNFRYRPGVVAMGKTAVEPSGAAGSDFFIVLGHGGGIKAEYAVLGRVRAGMSTVRRIGSLGTDTQAPSQVVKIESIRIHRRGAA